MAFLIPAPGREITQEDIVRLDCLVRKEKSASAVPSTYIIVAQFPETRSGKYVRRILSTLLLGGPLAGRWLQRM